MISKQGLLLLALPLSLRAQSEATTDSGAGGDAPLPGLSAAAGGAPQAAGEDRLSSQDALTATEQAIQLDELIKWIRAQAKVDNNRAGVPSLPTN